ncbi:hypothetical protein EHS25_010149 [Saitozyma podzolica]|uniref:Uncharacterized protein n=1 Tax=Saitozyma podzolica TaxID=1890683 RepID=A0A427YIS7_9TREE|nr:hypothetical protein EHS25_010149 [Saitozyma podzolica]
MFRPVLPTLRAAANQHRTMYSKATIVGRLGAAPAAKEGANGKSYYIYSLASSKPPRRNANGEIILGEDGRPVRDTNWFSIFNFAENAAPGMDRLQAGDLVMVEGRRVSVSVIDRSGDAEDQSARAASLHCKRPRGLAASRVHTSLPAGFYIFRLAALAAVAAVADLVASLDTRALGGAEGEPVHKEIVLREINHRILDRPPAKA